jgi:hypothetical protein
VRRLAARAAGMGIWGRTSAQRRSSRDKEVGWYHPAGSNGQNPPLTRLQVRLLAKRQAPTGGHPVVRTDALIRSGVDWGSFGTVLYVNDSCWDHQTDAMDDFVDRRPRDGPQVFWLDISQQPAKVRVAGSNPVVRSTVVRSRRPLQIIEETSLTTSVAV